MRNPATSFSVRKRVLVIDDEVTIGRSLVRSLAGDHDVVVMESATAAMALLASDAAFDVIFCDLCMPEVSGFDLFCWIKARSPELASKVVFMTGDAFSDRAHEFLATLTNPTIEKPFRLEGVRALIERSQRPTGSGTI